MDRLSVTRAEAKAGMRRRSSSIIQEVQPESEDDRLDQGALPNFNSSWVDAKGAWLIHPLLIILLRLLFNSLPTVSRELSWTLTNLSYMSITYLMFHWVKGIPFEFNAGAYDNLNMWEQMDNGEQYTPTKKWLTGVPVCLFLLSTHYTHYDLWMFVVNLMALLVVLVPKLPAAHRKRLNLNAILHPEEDDE
ncbi:putative unfolded protein response Orm1 [Saitoella complicata NRRL Y-17804]|nr:putative unfolded protein response Orm1 [Saitoella complicata NRRL Y-17804]ODQ54911.1 putative unfolded protein response Orm1 [Saitoella complicata NRRL Y-17804]